MLKVWKKKSAKDDVFLHLEEDGGGNVWLRVVSEKGQALPGGSLFVVRSDGSILLSNGVSEDFGFQLDTYGAVVVQHRGDFRLL